MMQGARVFGHSHGEAFMLMKYASRDGSVTEIIWNSRDGVTPFLVSSVDGVEMTHVEWENDIYAPDHQPKPGDRIFVDFTEQHAKEAAHKNALRYWDTYPPSRDQFETVEELEKLLYRGYLDSVTQGGPHLITVVP